MSFPANPTNNQQATLNGITYLYNAVNRTWTRISDPISSLNVSSNLTVANANVTTNLTANLAVLSNVYVADGLFWAGNGVSISSGGGSGADDVLRANVGAYQLYANANIGTLYLGNISTQANLGELYLGNVAINANLGAYQTWANATFATTGGPSTSDISANLGAYQIYANANAASQSISIDNVNANIGAYQLYANANAASQSISIDNVNANIGAYQTWANATFATTGGPSTSDISANLGAYQLYANANIGTLYLGNISTNANLGTIRTNLDALDANVGAFETYANANIGTLYLDNITTQANLGAYQTYANANIGTIRTNLDTLDANVGAFETYANTKIGNNSNSNLVVVATTTSTSTTTGALVVKGGVGVAGDLYATGISVAPDTTLADALNLNNNNLYGVNTIRIYDPGTSEGITWEGGSGWYIYESPNDLSNDIGNLQVVLNGTRTFTVASDGTINIPNTRVSTSTTTGALTVGGGLGVAGSVYAGELYTSNGIFWSGNGAAYSAGGGGSGTPGGSDTQIQFNDGSAFNGANITFNKNNGNLVISSVTTSTSTSTGALVVKGGIGVAGNVHSDKFYTANGIYWSGNGAAYGAAYTASTSAPTSSSVGSFWYNTSTDVLYEYINDGTSNYWVDISTQTIAANTAAPSMYAGDVFGANITFTGTITGSVGYLLERANIVASAPPAVTNLDLITAPIVYFTSNSTQNVTANIRGNSTVTLNSMLAIGQSATFVIFFPNSATARYVTTIKVDDTTITPFWQGGSTISSGSSNSIDVYTFAVLKTANATFKIFASQVKYQNLGP